jgi:hypothetical protein
MQAEIGGICSDIQPMVYDTDAIVATINYVNPILGDHISVTLTTHLIPCAHGISVRSHLRALKLFAALHTSRNLLRVRAHGFK